MFILYFLRIMTEPNKTAKDVKTGPVSKMVHYFMKVGVSFVTEITSIELWCAQTCIV
jgi:hypothetical protein